ncbi:hypothetical protein QFZ37_000686 [Chryseobacterium ginsenosidimutans]|uniref:hypothetical protein n=1 Tax=Chryseobacterium ginsenosidimutans TaxID=687846 RepID=UPI00277EABAB|nr:hypothetical protein [Chryseobacterium ginsenosidimutans]MDQ0592317.1 hypothetical protein [Chryseobacterium ginsenosidimutans]
MATFILLILLPPVLLIIYYVGFIVMTKTKIEQKDKDTKTHFMRLLLGFATFSVIAIFMLLIKWFLTLRQ